MQTNLGMYASAAVVQIVDFEVRVPKLVRVRQNRAVFTPSNTVRRVYFGFPSRQEPNCDFVVWIRMASKHAYEQLEQNKATRDTGIKVWEYNILNILSAHPQNISFYRKYHFIEWSCLDFENEIYHFTEISF